MRRLRSDLSMEWKVPLLVSGLLLVTVGALAIAAYFQVRDSARNAAYDRLKTVVDDFVPRLQMQTHFYAQQVDSLARRGEIGDYLRGANARDRTMAVLRSHLADRDRLGIEVWDSLGRRVLAVGPQVTQLPNLASDRAGLLTHPDAGTWIGALRALGDTIVFPAIAPVSIGGTVKPLGYVVMWHRIPGSAAARAAAGRLIGSEALLLLGSSEGAWTDQEHVVPRPPVPAIASGVVLRYVRPGIGPHLGFARAVPKTAWILLLEFPEPAVFATAHRFLVRAGLIGLVVLALGILSAWRLSRQITRPLRDLTLAADAMGEKAQLHVPVTRSDELGRLAAAFNRMTDRITEETAARRASEEEWRILFDRNPSPMWVVDVESLRFLAVNEAATRLYGYDREEFAGMTIKDIRPAEDVRRLLEDLAEGKTGLSGPELWRHKKKDGAVITVEITSHSLVFRGLPSRIVSANDVTVRAALEAQLRQSQKMEAIGSLSAGVAHDFNNVLAVIMTYTELARAELSAGSQIEKDLGHVLDAATRAHVLTRQLLTFGRQQALAPVALEPNAIVEGIGKLLHRVIGEDITLRTELTPNIGHILVDPAQFEQVLMNLAVNARDAMPRGGTLTIKTATAELDDLSARLHGLPASGHFVTIAVTDTGTGMTADTIARIFEPFFTTKESTKGTGLGLATVYGIIKQSGGHITVYSEIDRGTAFRVYLPRVDIGAAGTDAAQLPSDEPPQRGTETILLAEDDAAVRNATAGALQRLGYTVLPANGPQEALAIAAGHKGLLDLLISDIVMPGGSGPELVTALRALRPTVKVLLLSGYAGDPLSHRGIAEANLPLLAKPFTMRALAGKVREVLAAPPKDIL